MTSYVEELLESELSEEDFILLTKDKLSRHKELLAARIILEEREALSLEECDYLLPENLTKIGKYLVAVGEFEKAVDFTISFKFTTQDVVPFLIHAYFFYLDSSKTVLRFIFD